MNAPAAVRHLNYPGDVTSGLHVGLRMGPTDVGGEWLYVVAWAYDAIADWTRVGFSFVRPATTLTDSGGQP